MSKNRDSAAFGSGHSQLPAQTIAVSLDIEMLWYLHEVSSSYLIADCEHVEQAAATTLALEEAIVCCEDLPVDEAAVQIRLPDVLFLLGLVRRSDKDSSGRPVGLQASRQLMRARLALQRGELPTVEHGDRAYTDAVREEGENDA